MRYFIYYPPTKALKQVDVDDGTSIQEIIEMVRQYFGIRRDIEKEPKMSIVLNYNGSDLKSTWSLTESGIPPGAILHCLSRARKSIDLQVHCEFNHQTLEFFFDQTLNTQTTIGQLRKKISDQLGLPLSTFCLEKNDRKERLYDHMNLYHYEINSSEHIYLKVWHGYENLLSSCIKGFPKRYARDDLTRHYQLQIALYIAAFYGHMELGNRVLQLGARSDYPVGDHPARQWSSETTMNEMPEMLKCPIHIAIERGHMKMVDLFVRNSLFCTQAIHPISGFLPYRLASSLAESAKTNAERQRYKQIYLYLYDKQFNLKIPIKITNDGDSSMKTSHFSTTRTHYFSLPRYCKIIRWYDRARERVWKKYGVPIDHSIEIKRANRSKGLLGYKVLIDGFNNNFDSSVVSNLSETARSQAQIEETVRYNTYTDEERENMLKAKAYMKQFVDSHPLRTRTITNSFGRRLKNPPLLAQHGIMGSKMRTINFTTKNSSVISENLTSSSELSQSQDRSTVNDLDYPPSKLSSVSERPSKINMAQSNVTTSASFKPKENQHKRIQTAKSISTIHRKTGISLDHQKKEDEHKSIRRDPLPTPASTSNTPSIQSLWKQKIRMVASANITSNPQKETSPIPKLLSTSTHLTTNDSPQKIVTKNDSSKPTTQASKNLIEQLTTKTLFSHIPTDHSIVSDIDPSKSHSDDQTRKYFSMIHIPTPYNNQRKVIQTFERHANASIHENATECLREASFLKQKSWLKQVAFSTEMVKQRTKRQIQQPDQEKRNSITFPIRRSTSAAGSLYTNQFATSKVN